jgi:hypothetical protein
LERAAASPLEQHGLSVTYREEFEEQAHDHQIVDDNNKKVQKMHVEIMKYTYVP